MTPDKEKLLELAERCEKATASSFKLDDAIFEALLASGEKPEWGEFTASIDAAMTLVLEGWEWLIRSPSKDGPKDKGRFFARLESSDFESVTWGKGECWLTDHISGQEAKCWAATPALALCAAALRARASHPGDQS